MLTLGIMLVEPGQTQVDPCIYQLYLWKVERNICVPHSEQGQKRENPTSLDTF